MIERFVKPLKPSVMALIDVARSLVVVCMWRVTVDCHLCFQDGNDGQGTAHFFKIVVFSLHLSFAMGGFLASARRISAAQIHVKFLTSRQETGHGEKGILSHVQKDKNGIGSIMFLALFAVVISKCFPEGPIVPFQILYLFSQDPIPLQIHLRTS